MKFLCLVYFKPRDFWIALSPSEKSNSDPRFDGYDDELTERNCYILPPSA